MQYRTVCAAERRITQSIPLSSSIHGLAGLLPPPYENHIIYCLNRTVDRHQTPWVPASQVSSHVDEISMDRMYHNTWKGIEHVLVLL